MNHLVDLPEWQSLQAHYQQIAPLHLRDLFQQDPGRAERFRLDACGWFLDYSKNRIDRQTMDLLVKLAKACGVEEARRRMFSGEKINRTENRSVLHIALQTALRSLSTWTAKMSCPRSAASWTEWPTFRKKCGLANGWALKVGLSETW